MDMQQHQRQRPAILNTHMCDGEASDPFHQRRMSKLRENEGEAASASASSSAAGIMPIAKGSEDISVPAAAACAGGPFSAAGVERASTCSHAVNNIVCETLASAASTPPRPPSLRDTPLCPVTTGVSLSSCTSEPIGDEQSYQNIVDRGEGAECAGDRVNCVEETIRTGPCSHTTIGSRQIGKKSGGGGRSFDSGRCSYRGAIFRPVAGASSSILLRGVHSYCIFLYSRVIRRECKTKGALFSFEPWRSIVAALVSAGATCWAQAGEHVFVPAWLALANHLSLLLYLLLFFERLIEIIFHTAACLFPSFVYVLLALLVSILSIPPDIPPESAPPAPGVAHLQRTLSQQQRLVRVVLPLSYFNDASVAGDLTTMPTVGIRSFYKGRRHYLLNSRRHAPATAHSYVHVHPHSAEKFALRPAAVEVARPPHPVDASSSTSHSREKIRSNRLSTGSPGTRRHSCSTQGSYRCRVKKKMWHFKTLPGGASLRPGYAWSPDVGYWMDRNSLSRAANTNEGGDAHHGSMETAEVFGTEGTRWRKAGHSSGLPAEDKHHTAVKPAAAAISAPAAAAFEQSGAATRRNAQQVHGVVLEEDSFTGREDVGPSLFNNTKTPFVAPVDTAKAARGTKRKVHVVGKVNSSLTYDARAFIAGNNSRVVLMADVVQDVLQRGAQRREVEQGNHRGAPNDADSTSAGLAGASRIRVEREEEEKEAERKGGHLWLVALTVAYGYVFLSHVSRALLLELPMYSFALYLCQLLRLHGLTFCAGPNSTATATEELASRMRAQILSSSAAQGLSARESDVRNRARDGRDDSSSAPTGSSASGTSSVTTLTTSIRDSSGSPCVNFKQRSRRPVRRSRSVGSASSNSFEIGIGTSVYSKVWNSGVAGSRLEENVAFEKPAASRKCIFADRLAPVNAIKATDTGRRGYAPRNFVSPNPEWETVSARNEVFIVVENVQHSKNFEKASTRRKEGCCEDGLPLRAFQENSKPQSLPNLDNRQALQTHSDNAAEVGLRPAAQAMPATKGVALVSAGRAEDSVSSRTAMQADTKTPDMLSKMEICLGTRSSDEIDGRNGEIDCVAAEGGKSFGHAPSRQRSIHFTASEGQTSSVILPEVKKSVEQISPIKAGRRLPQEATAEEAQDLVARGRMPVPETPAAESHKETADLAAFTAGTLKPLDAVKVFSKRDDRLPMKMLETHGGAADAGAGKPEQRSTSVTGERSGLSKAAPHDTGSPTTSHIVALFGMRSCQTSPLAVMEKEDNTVLSGRLHGYSSDLVTVERSNTQNSDGREIYSNTGVTSKASIVRMHKRSFSCLITPRMSREISCSSINSNSKTSAVVSPAIKEKEDDLLDCVGRAKEETADERPESGGLGASPTERRRRPDIALLFQVFVKLPGILWLSLRGVFRRCSCHLSAVAASHFMQNLPAWFASPEKLIEALHPFNVLGISPVRFFPSASRRLIFTTCCFWLLRGLHGDIFDEQEISALRGAERTSESGLDGVVGSGVTPFASSSFLVNMRENTRSTDTSNTGNLYSKNISGNKGKYLSERRRPRRKGSRAWKGRVVEADIMRVQLRNASVREVSSVLFYSAAGGDTLTARVSHREAIVAEQSINPLEERVLSSSTTRGKLQETRKFSQSAPRRRRQGWVIFTWLPQGDGLNSYFLLLYACLLELFSWAGEFIHPLRQWTAWLALLLLLLLLVSYSLLSLSSTVEILPWQLVHILVVLRHTSLCTYAAHVAKEPKSHLQAEKEKRGQRFFGKVRNRQEANVEEKTRKQQALKPGQQARSLLQLEVVSTGTHPSKADDGVDENKVSSHLHGESEISYLPHCQFETCIADIQQRLAQSDVTVRVFSVRGHARLIDAVWGGVKSQD